MAGFFGIPSQQKKKKQFARGAQKAILRRGRLSYKFNLPLLTRPNKVGQFFQHHTFFGAMLFKDTHFKIRLLIN
jgi:hypothetical protein